MDQTLTLDDARRAVAEAFARAGTITDYDPDSIDDLLNEITEKASGSVLKRRFDRDFPMAAQVDLLAVVAALRQILDLANSATATELIAWDRQRVQATPTSYTLHTALFRGGPYDGITMDLKGPADGIWAGPPSYTPISFTSPTYGTGSCYYQRIYNLDRTGPAWIMTYREDRNDHVPADAQPDAQPGGLL